MFCSKNLLSVLMYSLCSLDGLQDLKMIIHVIFMRYYLQEYHYLLKQISFYFVLFYFSKRKWSRNKFLWFLQYNNPDRILTQQAPTSSTKITKTTTPLFLHINDEFLRKTAANHRNLYTDYAIVACRILVHTSFFPMAINQNDQETAMTPIKKIK